jgi:AT-rich interactive domain-containing protein 2
MKVNTKNEWSEIEKEIGFPEKCVNSELALKHIYIRYFDKYERLNFLGEEKERIDEDEEESRHKRWTARALHSIPQSYNHGVHQISDSVRAAGKLSTDLYQSSEYDKLSLSLLSPLPNEQDFAINVLTLMSNECKQTLRLWKSPKLISVLLAHAGIYEFYNMREIFREFYTVLRGHSLEQFWIDSFCDKPDLFDLLYEDGLTNESVFKNPEEMKRLYGNKDKVIEDLNEFPFLGIGRNYGTQDVVGQRIHQVSSIIRNLSFFEENSAILANNRTLMRFVILMANNKWNDLHVTGLDVIGNIANEIELKDPLTDLVSRHLLGTIIDGLESKDRALILSSLEILGKLSQNESNEDVILKSLKKENYEQICLLVLVQDMLLLVFTLECLYSLTSLGEKPCNLVVDIKGVLDTLVSLLTIEAQSLGPGSCIQMRVIETVPVHVQKNHPNVQQQVMRTPNQVHPNIMRTPEQRVVYQSPQKVETPSRAEMLFKQNQQQIIQENEQFANAWLRGNFELSPSLMVKIEEQDLYRMYYNACQKVGRKGAITQLHFPRIVRSVFGGTVGPNPSENPDKPLNYYCGIKPKAAILQPQQQQPEQPKSEMIVIHPNKPSPSASDSALVAQLNQKAQVKIHL